MFPILERFPRAEDLEFGSDERTAEEVCEPQTLAIEIDAAENRLYLRCGEQLLLDAACSTGSGEVLRTEDMTWWFDTPRGNFKVESIARGPVWRKPDWAYLEEGEEIPSEENQRLVPGALGDFALMIKEGLFIHGTLYERLLGESVTHGCIRLGSQDLAFLVENVEVPRRVARVRELGQHEFRLPPPAARQEFGVQVEAQAQLLHHLGHAAHGLET